MEIFKLGQIKTLMMFFILIFSFTPMSEKAFADQTMNIDRDKSTVLITGSNRGIGLALAQNYAEQGWNVIATCRKPKKRQNSCLSERSSAMSILKNLT